MNALRAPLTALHVSMREYASFSLDSADAFIDMRFSALDNEKTPDVGARRTP